MWHVHFVIRFNNDVMMMMVIGGFEDRVETNGRAHRRSEAIALSAGSMRSVTKRAAMPKLYAVILLLGLHPIYAANADA